MKRLLSFLVCLVLIMAIVGEALAQRSFGRSGGFGGGGRSFGGGGGFSRSSGGGSFGRSGGGSFFGGGSSRSSGSYSAPRSNSYSGPRSSTGSFGRSGSFGNSGRVNSSSINPNRNYGGSNYGSRTTFVYGGSPYSYYGGGGFWSGYSMGVLTSPWTHWMPWHPGFYVNPPYYSNGAYYDGGFSFSRFILGIIVIVFIIWLLGRLFRGGSGGGRIKYTNYR